jgi:DNA polymerase-4
VAKIAATLAKPHGLIYVPNGTEEDFLSPLPVEMISGIGPKTHKAMLQRGIKTIGDLMSTRELADRFLGLGEADQSAAAHDHSIGNETTLERPLKLREKMEEVLWELVEEVGGRLRREKLYARCLTLKIRYTNFHTLTRSRTLLSPTCFDREIFEVVSDLLRSNLAQGGAIRLLGVSASALQTSGWQEPLLNRQQRHAWEKLYQAIDQLRHKYGENSIGTATPRRHSD